MKHEWCFMTSDSPLGSDFHYKYLSTNYLMWESHTETSSHSHRQRIGLSFKSGTGLCLVTYRFHGGKSLHIRSLFFGINMKRGHGEHSMVGTFTFIYCFEEFLPLRNFSHVSRSRRVALPNCCPTCRIFSYRGSSHQGISRKVLGSLLRCRAVST